MAQILTDRNNRTYTLALNLGAARRIQEMTGLNLLADTVFSPLSAATGGNGVAAGGMSAALPQVEADPVQLAAVLWAAVEPECEPRHITREMFDDGWDGPSLKRAYAVLVEAITDFFPDRAPKIRKMAEALDQARQKDGQAREAMVEAGAKLLAGIDIEGAVEKMLAQAERDLAGVSKTPGSASGRSPGNSDSTPADVLSFPSAN